MRNRMSTSLLLMTSCLLTSGCITIGPKTKTEIVVQKPGKPMLITENVKAEGVVVEGQEPVKQDIGGWKTMPPEHWKAVTRKIERLEAENAKLKGKGGNTGHGNERL